MNRVCDRCRAILKTNKVDERNWEAFCDCMSGKGNSLSKAIRAWEKGKRRK